MLSWFPQGPPADANKETRAFEEPNSNETDKPALPHDRILGDLFDRHGSADGPVYRASSDPTAVYDPFDGTLLGTLVAPDQNVQPEEPGQLNDVAAKNEELWSHLSRVFQLQNQISSDMMEEFGMHASDKGKGTRSRATSVSRVVIDDVEGDEGIGGKHDEEAERTKAREEQFSKLAGQFRGKKEAINGIMIKLDALSRAVTEFHALQAPKIEFPSTRHNSLSATTVAEPVDDSPMRTHLNPGALKVVPPPALSTLLRRADEPATLQLVESPMSTIVPLPP
ncbi:hypothetical protein C8R43DRAFT_992812 [Mycena crocata]|nr:hypothetical protein C8R43DRAFT_992812 [Mycena crocata]